MRLFIQTPRLSLRPYALDDAPRVAELINDRGLARMLARVPHPYSVADAETWLGSHIADRASGDNFVFAITLPEAGVIGACGVERVAEDAPIRNADIDVWEIGYWLGRAYWGKGYATEAAQAVMDWAGVELDAQVFTAGHFFDNPASGKVLRKLGFVHACWTEATSLARSESAPSERYVWPRGVLAAKHGAKIGAHAPH